MRLYLFAVLTCTCFLERCQTAYVDYQLQRPDLRYGSKDVVDPNYRITTTVRTTTPRNDPDSFFFGFFPIWSAILVALTACCLFVSIMGVMCWLAGFVNPRRQMASSSTKDAFHMRHSQQIEDTFSQHEYDDISVRMLDTYEKSNASHLFNDSKLIGEYDADYKLKKKMFLREHL